ncbi:MAG: glycosyltransferase family 4 protein [Alphaproteobacteria bacterium]|nr:glycosyltransferase family 4 protein [Alphaproteobacteria bacterium]
MTILYHHRTRARDGQSVHIDELIRALQAEGHRVVVVEPRRVEATAQTIERQLLPRFVYELAEFAYSFLEFAKLAAAALRHRPDVLYERANLYMLSGLWTAKLFRLPYLLEVNAPLAQERGKFGGLSWPQFAAWTERSCWRGASVALPVTAALAEFLRSAGVAPERIAVTPNGVDLSEFRPHDMAEAKARLGLQGALVLGFVGYVREWHGLDRIVELLARRPPLADARLLVVGDGPARPALEQQAASLGISDRIRFTGTAPRTALPELISAMDIALQPEVTAYASPLKLFEYMALGRTIVAPATPNILEVLEDGSDALLFPQGDSAALAAAIERLAADQALRERLGAAAAAKIVARDMTWRGNARRVAAAGKPRGVAVAPA